MKRIISFGLLVCMICILTLGSGCNQEKLKKKIICFGL